MLAPPESRAHECLDSEGTLQSDLADTGSERLVAPLALRARIAVTTPRLAPIVSVGGSEYLVLVPRLAALPAASLRDLRGQLVRHRDAIVAALDLLFLGV